MKIVHHLGCVTYQREMHGRQSFCDCGAIVEHDVELMLQEKNHKRSFARAMTAFMKRKKNPLRATLNSCLKAFIEAYLIEQSHFIRGRVLSEVLTLVKGYTAASDPYVTEIMKDLKAMIEKET